jgi:hypothetical protein
MGEPQTIDQQEEYEDHIKNIQKKKIYDPNKSILVNIKNIAKSMSIIGCINLLIFVIFTFLVQLYMSKGTKIFEGFRWYHHLMWIGIILVQVIYMLLLIIFPKNVDSLMEAALYDIFTVEIIMTNGSVDWNRLVTIIKNLLKAILVEPLMEYIFLLVLITIPWPFLKKLTYMNRMNILFMKAGLFNIIISLVCMNYSTWRVNTELVTP